MLKETITPKLIFTDTSSIQKYNKRLIITINQKFLINTILYYFFRNTFMIMKLLKCPRI